MTKELLIQEISLSDVAHGSMARRELLRVHHSWVDAGLVRWFSLFDPKGPWPVCLLAASMQPVLSAGASQSTPQQTMASILAVGNVSQKQSKPEGGERQPRWMGTIVGVWAPAPLDRFDDLLEMQAAGGWVGASRPVGGVWHLVAATVAPEARGMDLGRQLVNAALGWVQQLSAQARVVTLSPAVGLPQWTVRVREHLQAYPAEAEGAGQDFAALVPHVVHTLSRADGTPILPILRLHLKAGACLDKVLFESRADERRSGRVNLRFAYEVEEARRVAQQAIYRQWCQERAASIRAGRGMALDQEGTIWWVPGHREPLIWRELQTTTSSLDVLLSSGHYEPPAC